MNEILNYVLIQLGEFTLKVSSILHPYAFGMSHVFEYKIKVKAPLTFPSLLYNVYQQLQFEQ